MHDKTSPKKQKENGQQDLQFVNLPSSLKLDVAARKRVRSHVARDFRRRAEGSGPVNLGVDVNITRHVNRDSAPGQRHRFRVSRQGLEETRTQPKLKIPPRKASTVSSDSSDSRCYTIRTADDTDDAGGAGAQSVPTLQTPISTDEESLSLVVDTSYDSISLWDWPIMGSDWTSINSQSQTPQSVNQPLGPGQLMRQPAIGHGHLPAQVLHLSSTVSGNLDPFNTIPIESSSRTQTLMHHCKLLFLSPYP
jgi:hypothetical protein